jgi:ATP-dependent DNA helicase RecG
MVKSIKRNEILELRIRELIRQGENTSIEFKSKDVNADSLSKEIVAMLNTSGGNILLGVGDTGTLEGIDDSKNWEEWVANLIRNNVLPPAEIIYTEIEIENKLVINLEIPKGKDKPYQTNKNQFLIRIGSTNRVASQQELLRMFQIAGYFHYDTVTLEHSSPKDLDQNRIANYFEQYNIDFEKEENPIQLLKNIDILASESDHLTVAGNLLFGLRPQKFLTNAGITFAAFKGNTISEDLIHQQKIDGSLPTQVDQTLSHLKLLIPISSTIEGAKRVDTSVTYDDKVYRELIVNAVVHRDYAISGSRIRIFKFDDRIELRSPGRLPNTVNLEKIKYGVSYARNPVIVKFMENMRYIDQMGRGIPMVVKEVNLKKGQILFEEIGEEFVVTLWLPTTN